MNVNASFLCPHCALPVEAGPELFGLECACPGCGGNFVVPLASEAPISRGEHAQAQRESEQILRENERLQAELRERVLKQQGWETDMGRLRGELSEARMRAETERAAWDKQKEGFEKNLSLARKEVADLKKMGEERADAARLREEALQREAEQHLGRLSAMSSELEQLREQIRSLEALPRGQVPEMWAFSSAPPAENRWIGSAIVALAVGVLIGVWGAGHLMRGSKLRLPPPEQRSAMAAPLPEQKSEASAVPESSGNVPSSREMAQDREPPKNAPIASEVPKAGDAGLPQTFLGARLGERLKDFLDREPSGLWRERGGRFHRKSELEGAEVEAVLMPDRLGRLLMGAYVRVCASEPDKLAPFLEWAVAVQEDFAERHGEPTEVHQVQGASDDQSVVGRIAAGTDYYEAHWRRPGEDAEILLSLRSLNERSVVFRLEIRSAALSREYFQATAPSAEAPSTPVAR